MAALLVAAFFFFSGDCFIGEGGSLAFGDLSVALVAGGGGGERERGGLDLY